MTAAARSAKSERPLEAGLQPLVESPVTTAVILAETEGSSLRIAALAVMDRLAVSLHRAGIKRLLLVGRSRVALPRASALGVRWEHVDGIPALSEPVVIVPGNVLASVGDLRRVLQARGRLLAPDGQGLPLGVVANASGDWRARLESAPGVPAGDPAAVVTSETVHDAERQYWASLSSSSDGVVDRHFNRPVGRLLSKRLAGTGITPNQVSVIASLIGLASAALFALGTPGAALAGALVLQLSAVIDCVDGDLARALFRQSALGKWLDIVGDQVVHIAVFLGIGVGLWRSGSGAPVIALGAVAALGVVLSFLVVLRALLRPALRGRSRLQRLIDATTNRDFSVLLLGFALFQVLDWFLWLAAVGSHVFWIVAAVLQIQESRSETVQTHAQGA